MLDPQAAVWLVRQEWSRVVAVATRILGDLDEAEDMAQEALLEATRRWPVDGVPANPGAWLTTVARNRALNRRRDERRRGGPALALDDWLVPAATGDAADAADLDGFGDDRLRLVVLCCHPSLHRDAQVALTLRLMGGLTVREIANAFLQAEATVAQRISRAKKRLREHHARFELPPMAELPARLGAVLEVVYLVVNEGYGPTAATSGGGPCAGRRRCSPTSSPRSPPRSQRCGGWPRCCSSSRRASTPGSEPTAPSSPRRTGSAPLGPPPEPSG